MRRVFIRPKAMMTSTALLALCLAPAGANAQSQPGAEQEEADNGIESIVVTARRSAERLQDVPVAVTALSGQFLERQNVMDATALPRFAPNLLVASLPSNISGASVYIRGIGNNEPSTVAEQGVGVYLDGVYIARSSGTLFDAVDLDRVEVLRGPQGTVFGRNTIGGAIQFVTRKPGNEFAVEARAGYGRYNDAYVRGRIDTGQLGNLPLKFSITAQHRQSDGYVDNILVPASEDPGSMNSDSLVLAAELDLGDVTVNYSFDMNDRKGTTGHFQLVAASPDFISYFGASPSYGGPPLLISRERMQKVQQVGFPDNGTTRYDSTARVSGHTLNLAWEVIPELTLKSITGFRRFRQDTVTDLGGTGPMRGVVLDPVTFQPSVGMVLPYTGRIDPVTQRQESQELQAVGAAGDFSYLAGLYYFHEKTSEYNDQKLTFVLPGGQAGMNLRPIQAIYGSSESKAAFGQVSWKPSFLDSKLEITGGLRYTEDSKSLRLAGDVNPSITGNVKFDNVSWLGSLSYQINPDILVYTRASTGYRSGGINPRATVINIFRPEKAKAFEAGLKSEWFDRRLRLNLAAYSTDYTDRQITQFAAGSAGATSLIVNAGRVQLSGFEAELAAAPVRGLNLDASIGYVHTKYKKFEYRDPVTDIVTDVASIAKPIYTPKWTLHLGAEYVYNFEDMAARLRLDYSQRSEIYFNALNNPTVFNEDIKSGTDRNLKARFSLEDFQLGAAKLDFGVWGDNLTNQKNIAFGIDFGGLGFAGAIYKQPVTYGVDVKVRF